MSFGGRLSSQSWTQALPCCGKPDEKTLSKSPQRHRRSQDVGGSQINVASQSFSPQEKCDTETQASTKYSTGDEKGEGGQQQRVTQVPWPEVEDGMVRLGALRAAIAAKRSKRDALMEKVAAAFQGRAGRLQQVELLDRTRKCLQLRAVQLAQSRHALLEQQDTLKEGWNLLKPRAESLMASARALAAAQVRLQEAERMLSGEAGVGRLGLLNELIVGRQKEMLAHLSFIYPLGTVRVPHRPNEGTLLTHIWGSSSKPFLTQGLFGPAPISSHLQALQQMGVDYSQSGTTLVDPKTSLDRATTSTFSSTDGPGDLTRLRNKGQECSPSASDDSSSKLVEEGGAQRAGAKEVAEDADAKPGGPQLSIAGLHLLPPGRQGGRFWDKQELQTQATALGYVAHVVVLAAGIMGVPLRYPVDLGASHSHVRDPSPAAEGSYDGGIVKSLPAAAMRAPLCFPLYASNSDQSKLAVGVFLLNKDIEQLLNVLGFDWVGPKHTLQNLRKLLRTGAQPSTFPS
eukprot:jgi/Mesen1/3570/ME000002S05141